MTAAQGLAAVQENDLDRALSTIEGQFARKAKGPFFDTSYTRSVSKDDMGTGGTGYGLSNPSPVDPHRFYGPSPWDVPHRLSLTFSYGRPRQDLEQ